MRKRSLYGYARKSAKDKNAAEQSKVLKEAGVSLKNLFVDQVSEKEKLRQIMDSIRPGDVFVIKNLRQLGYSYREILNEWEILVGMLGAHVRVLDMPLLDTSAELKDIDGSFISKFFLQIISFVAEHEQADIRQRQADGIAYAKLLGKHIGRPRIQKPIRFDEVYDRWRAGELTADEARAKVNLKRSTFERFAKERKMELRKAIAARKAS